MFRSKVTLGLDGGKKEIVKEFSSLDASKEWILVMSKNPRFLSGSNENFSLIREVNMVNKGEYDKIYNRCLDYVRECVEEKIIEKEK